jgi:hypothetical protein
MSKKRRAGRRSMQLATARAGNESAEWVGGRLPTPFFVGDEAEEPFRAEIALWLEQPTGLILAQRVLHPGDAEGALGRALVAAMEHPMVGPARRPPAVRVAEAALEAEVRAALGDATPIRIAPTPELDEAVELMTAGMGELEEAPGYLEGGRVRPEAVAALFAAARRLYLARPWSFADDDQVLRLDIPALGVEGACVSVIGALGEAHGMVIFPSLGAFDSFCAACDRDLRKRGRVDFGTSWIGLHYGPRSELAPAMQREIDAHGWAVAGPDAYPRVEHTERDGVKRPLDERDLRIATAAAGALGAFASRHRRSFGADEIEPICESYFDGDDLEAILTIPYEAYELFERAPTPEAAPPLPAVRPGRNDPCPCGSGKKFKKCHLGAYEESASATAGVSPLHRLDDLRTMSGDPLLVTVDRFFCAPGAEREIEARLAAIEDVVLPWSGDDEPSYVFLAPAGEGGGSERTVLGRAWLARGTLHVETLSRERAAALRRTVEGACGELIRHQTREHADPLSRSPRKRVRSGPKVAPPPGAEQLVLDLKTRHYADWADHPLPALGGQTPRAAMQTAKGRAAVDVLLKDMEHGEQASPRASRFDFGILRRELGLEP